MSAQLKYPRVFISYRHDDSSKWAKSLFNLLAEH